MEVNNKESPEGANREGRAARLDKWTAFSAAVVLMAATLTPPRI